MPNSKINHGGRVMTQESKETLNRAAEILEGLSVSQNLTTAETDLIVAVTEMIDAVLKKEDTE